MNINKIVSSLVLTGALVLPTQDAYSKLSMHPTECVENWDNQIDLMEKKRQLSTDASDIIRTNPRESFHLFTEGLNLGENKNSFVGLYNQCENLRNLFITESVTQLQNSSRKLDDTIFCGRRVSFLGIQYNNMLNQSSKFNALIDNNSPVEPLIKKGKLIQMITDSMLENLDVILDTNSVCNNNSKLTNVANEYLPAVKMNNENSVKVQEYFLK